MRRQRGITLVELLIALAVLGILMAAAYQAINGSLQVHADQEALSSAQSRLRRVVEVVTQDVRSAVFGSITSVPFESDQDSISFMLLAGGAGYPVEPELGFENEYSTIAIANSPHNVSGQQFAMVNGNGQAVIFRASGASMIGPGRYRVHHSGCQNTIPYVGSVQLFEISTIGLRYVAEEQTIVQSINQGDERPFAFSIDGMHLSYIYRTSASVSEPIIERNTPYYSNGVPTRTHTDASGNNYLLDRVKLTLTATEPGRGRDITRTYTGYVDLSSNQHFQVKEVLPCGA